MLGDGVSEVSWLAQVEVSLATMVVSLACALVAACGVRREIVSTRETDALDRRLLRMWEPWKGD